MRQVESERQSKAQEELLAAQREQKKLHTTMLQMMQNQNIAILQPLSFWERNQTDWVQVFIFTPAEKD